MLLGRQHGIRNKGGVVTDVLNDHRLKPENLKVQGSGLKVLLQMSCTPNDSCQFCFLFKV